MLISVARQVNVIAQVAQGGMRKDVDAQYITDRQSALIWRAALSDWMWYTVQHHFRNRSTHFSYPSSALDQIAQRLISTQAVRDCKDRHVLQGRYPHRRRRPPDHKTARAGTTNSSTLRAAFHVLPGRECTGSGVYKPAAGAL
jgi:hypothetical protein